MGASQRELKHCILELLIKRDHSLCDCAGKGCLLGSIGEGGEMSRGKESVKMKLHRLLMGLVFAVVLLIGGCSESSHPSRTLPPGEVTATILGDGVPCGEELVVTLWAGQHIDVGHVTVFNDADDLYIRIETTGGWSLTETHVGIATNLEEIPQTGSGNPQVGHFDLAAEHDPPVSYYEYHVNYAYEPGQELFLAVHAAVVLMDDGGNPIQEETAWADGYDFPGNNWATYFNFTIADCAGGESIIVTVPDQVCLFDPFPIAWSPAGEESGVRIDLLRDDGTLCTVIETYWPNIGSYNLWDAYPECQGEEEPFAGVYLIRVTDVDTGATGLSGATTIIDCGAGPE